MNSEFDIKIKNLNKAAGRRHVFRNIVALLCCAVFLFTGYSLAFKGITLTSSDEDVINENEAETQYLILQCKCKKEDVTYHEHNEFCYDRDGNLVCELEQNVYEPPVVEATEDPEAEDPDIPEDVNDNQENAGENTGSDIINNLNEENKEENEEKVINKDEDPVPETPAAPSQEEIEAMTHNHTAACCISDSFETKKEFENAEVSLSFNKGVLPVMADQKISKKIIPLEKEETFSAINEKEENYNYCYAFDIALLNNGYEILPNGKFDIKIKINENLEGTVKEVVAFSHYKDGTIDKEQVIMPDDNVFHFVVSEFGHFGILIKTENNFVSALNLAKGALRGEGIQGDFENGYTNVPETSFLYALLDDTTNIGVPKEDDTSAVTFDDSVYTYEKDFTGSAYQNIDIPDNAQKTGGIVWGFSDAAITHKNYIAEQLWDGNAPFRVSGLKAANPMLHFNYNELQLENGTVLTNWGNVDTSINGIPVKVGALKFDNWYFEHHNIGSDHNYFYARGNKLVMGENITQEDPVTAVLNADGTYTISNTDGFEWGIFGGYEDKTLVNATRTNVVVASGGWSFIYGGSNDPSFVQLGDTNLTCAQGTNIAVRGDAIVKELYGGSNDASVGNENYGININIYDGITGTIYGGCEVDDDEGILVNNDITVNVSGGHVNEIYLGHNFYTPYKKIRQNDRVNENKKIINTSIVKGSAILNISDTGNVKNVYGDEHRNEYFGDPGSNYHGGYRRIKGPTVLNVSASNDFNEMEYFDEVNIRGENVIVSTVNTTGDSYIGSITVQDGATLYLDNGGIINIPYDTNYETSADKNLIGADTGNTIYTLHHAWNGEQQEADRADSRLLIDGQGVINKATASRFNTQSNTTGLRIHGYVEGYSVLDVNDAPIYSDDTDYYYYVIADASSVGAAAFREPAGADYIVCFRHLKDENNNDIVGWYLREKPEISVANSLIRTGENTSTGPMTVHIKLNGLAYEWSDVPGSNHVEFGFTSYTGAENSTTGNHPFTLSQITDITQGTTSTYSAVFDDGRLYSIDLIVDNSTATEPIYAEGYVNYRYIDTNYTGMDYTDSVGTADGIRAVYDFAGNDQYHSDEGYEDSIMVTSPFSTTAKGADTALLRVYLPENVSADLSVEENNGTFEMTNGTDPVNLVNSNTITTNFGEDDPDIFNNNFGINISNGDLAGGYTQAGISGITKLPCSVFSYRNIDYRDISKNDSDGLNLAISLSNIKHLDKPVNAQNEPSAVNEGELQIQVVPYIISLTIEKETIGMTDEPASFTVVLRDADNNIITPSTSQNYTVDNYGNISFTLNSGENVIIPDITVGSTFTITQNNSPTFAVIYKEGNTELSMQHTYSQTITESKTIKVINMPSTVLPSTGGNTEIFYIISGLLIIFTVLIFFFVFRRKIYIQNKSKKGVLS